MINHYWMDDRLRLALLKESAAYRIFWEAYGGDKALTADKEVAKYWAENPNPSSYPPPNPLCPAEVPLCNFFESLFAFKITFDDSSQPRGENLKQVLDVLNPYNEDMPDPLPFGFYKQSPIAQLIIFSGDPLKDYEGSKLMEREYDYVMPLDIALARLQPSERLLRIDLSRTKEEVIAEIKRLYAGVNSCRIQKNVSWAENYDQWQQETKRKRQETWQALKVWKVRRQKKSFLAISKETHLRVPAAKKAFARAYELIEGRKYDKETFKKIFQEIQSTGAKKEVDCNSCRQLSICAKTGDYCPDMLALLPTEGSMRESWLPRSLDEVLENFDPDNHEESIRRRTLYSRTEK